MLTRYRPLAFLFYAAIALLLSGGVRAEEPQDSGGSGNLLVAPTRVVLEGRARSAEVILHNQGDKEATYRITLIRLRMKDNGEYEEVEKHGGAKSGELFADDILRYSPRQVTLKGGESQTVKVMARLPEGLTEGEYRSHLKFEAVPPASFGEDVEAQTLQQGQISIRLIPLFGVSIPVIVRHGPLTSKASIAGLQRNDKNLSLELHRTGTQSTFGDVIATLNPAGGGSPVVVGEMRGIAVFTPNAMRRVTLALTPPAGVQLSQGGTLTVTYRERAEAGGKTIAETALKL